MHSTDYRTRLLQDLCDPKFATEYFVAVARSGDPVAMQLVVTDLLEAGGGIYPLVELIKLRACTNPAEPSGTSEKYILGEVNATSLPADYTLTGILITPPRVGANVIILRLNRNGIALAGVYQSTEVTNCNDGEFTTLNSVYTTHLLPNFIQF